MFDSLIVFVILEKSRKIKEHLKYFTNSMNENSENTKNSHNRYVGWQFEKGSPRSRRNVLNIQSRQEYMLLPRDVEMGRRQVEMGRDRPDFSVDLFNVPRNVFERIV